MELCGYDSSRSSCKQLQRQPHGRTWGGACGEVSIRAGVMMEVGWVKETITSVLPHVM